MIDIQLDKVFLKSVWDQGFQKLEELIQKKVDQMILEDFRHISLTNEKKNDLRRFLAKEIRRKLLELFASMYKILDPNNRIK